MTISLQASIAIYKGAIVFLFLSWSPITFLPSIFQQCDFTPMILKQISHLPLFHYVILTVLNMMWKDRITLMILPLMWVFRCDFTLNPDFSKCIWFCRKFWNIFQILLNFKFRMKILFVLGQGAETTLDTHNHFWSITIECTFKNHKWQLKLWKIPN
jgi:hypothetical protein